MSEQTTPAPQQAAPGAGIPPMPTSAAGALGFLSGYFAGRQPGALAGDGVLGVLAAALFWFLALVLPSVKVLTPTLMATGALLGILATICVIISAARFIGEGCCRKG